MSAVFDNGFEISYMAEGETAQVWRAAAEQGRCLHLRMWHTGDADKGRRDPVICLSRCARTFINRDAMDADRALGLAAAKTVLGWPADYTTHS